MVVSKNVYPPRNGFSFILFWLAFLSSNQQVACYLTKKMLATVPSIHYTGSIGYYLCLSVQTQFQLGSYIHACTNEGIMIDKTNPYFGRHMHNDRQHKLARVELNLVDLLENVFLCVCMHVTTQLHGIVFV